MKRLRYLVSGLLLLLLVGAAQAQDSPRLIIDIDRLGQMSVLPEGAAERLDEEASREHVLAQLSRNPALPILLRSDVRAPFSSYSRVATWLKESGAESIGILIDGE